MEPARAGAHHQAASGVRMWREVTAVPGIRHTSRGPGAPLVLRSEAGLSARLGAI